MLQGWGALLLVFTNVFICFQVLGLSFSPNGYHLASGGEDNTCRIWDLRKRKSLYVIPAHSNLISQVKFEPQEGYFLVTGSYDTTAKVYNCKTVILHMKCVLSAVFSLPFHALIDFLIYITRCGHQEILNRSRRYLGMRQKSHRWI